MPEPARRTLRAVRRGEVPLDDVLDAISDGERRLRRLKNSTSLGDQPDRAWVDAWLHRSYLSAWSR